MNKEKIIIIFGTPHRLREPGKQSCDGRLHEAIYGRELIKEMVPKLQSMGYRVMTDFESLDLPKTMQSPSVTTERQRELGMRVNLVNEVCRQEGKDRVLYVSVHVNAACGDGRWHDANGWQVCVSPKSSDRSRLLAECLFDAAKSHDLKMRQPTARQKYWEQNLYVLNQTMCAAVLTENLFMDNLDDVDFLLSDEGRHVIERVHVEGIARCVERM